VGTQLRPVKKRITATFGGSHNWWPSPLFVDIAHFVPAPFLGFLGFLGSLIRIFIRAPAGRKRFNVLGALNAITDQLITVTNKTHIKAESVGDLLRQIAGLNLGVPMALVMDPARDQKCKIVRQLASVLAIELLYLLTYCPNLNRIEGFWKFPPKKCQNMIPSFQPSKMLLLIA